jgi:hypothetical protein
MSVDGCIAGPGETMDWIFDYWGGEEDRTAADVIANNGEGSRSGSSHRRARRARVGEEVSRAAPTSACAVERRSGIASSGDRTCELTNAPLTSRESCPASSFGRSTPTYFDTPITTCRSTSRRRSRACSCRSRVALGQAGSPRFIHSRAPKATRTVRPGSRAPEVTLALARQSTGDPSGPPHARSSSNPGARHRGVALLLLSRRVRSEWRK